MSPGMTVEAIYGAHCAGKTAIAAHLPRLRALADGLELAVEFGVKRGASSSALLLGAARVVSFDITPTPEARELEAIAGGRWDYRIEDSRHADVADMDLLFVDSLHDYEQCRAELFTHGNKAKRFIACHDTQTFWEVGANGETGRKKWDYVPGRGSVPLDCLGVGQAILEFMAANHDWRVHASYPDSHGLLVLERQ
jgi:hypothetical protein